MKKVLALALLFSISGIQAMDMSKLNAMMMDNGMAMNCAKLCTVTAACCLAKKMMSKDDCPTRSANDTRTVVADIANKLTDGSVQAVLQRVFSPFGQVYSRDWQSVAVDSVVNAAVTEVDSKLGISSLYPTRIQVALQTEQGKFAYIAFLNAVAKAAYTYAVSQLPATVVKK
ncbi:MAG: hypothetical protein P4L22_00695 [Candidatus Babeliales bacterium]|nr:hypothetical protein [Candidatus Babeliales bacterium]